MKEATHTGAVKAGSRGISASLDESPRDPSKALIWVLLLALLLGVVSRFVWPHGALGGVGLAWGWWPALAGGAFVCEFVDSTLGMGYGTTLAPMLLLLGWNPHQVVPAILLSELLTGAAAAGAHHAVGNADLSRGGRQRTVGVVLGVCGTVGAAGAVLVAVRIAPWLMKLWVGGIVTAMGILVLLTSGRRQAFSWSRLVGLGVVASFNKGLSGGGYGPLLTSGQIVSGVEERAAVACTSLAESITCGVALLMYLFLKKGISWPLALPLVVGGLASVPLAAWTVRASTRRTVRQAVGLATLLLGGATILSTVL